MPGKNGIHLILLGLLWWGRGLHEPNVEQMSLTAWEAMVDDVSWVLSEWVRTGAMSPAKRPRGKRPRVI